MDAGAKAAIGGFRLQALYTLALMVEEADSAKVFQPEGKEDLAVYENGNLIRVIQVKAYSSPLRLSDLDPQRETSFLRRLVNFEDTSCVPQLVSFGPLGPELAAIQQREDEALAKLSEKLGEYGYSVAEIDAITQRLDIVQVHEAALRERVYEFFTHTITAGEPDRAFDLLVWWILQAAENRRRITFQILRDQLLAIGRYFAERAAHHDEWFTTIKPLDESTAAAPASSTLAEEYYRGTAARYTHIRAGLDVRRAEQLEAIQSYFTGNRKVVIIHGASGQGKTSLALRYLHDYVPSDWRFMVTAIDDRRHAARIATALADHLKVVNAPVWLFIDVAPRDLQWVALIRELLDIDNIRILVAIREEDLARRVASESEIGFPADIRLELSAQEAANVYAQLVQQAAAINAFPTFTEAWERFGGEGPLLEFVYLVTQTQSLHSVLAAQVRRLREEVRSGVLEASTLRFLHICAVATSFEARVKLAPLAVCLELRDPAGTVELFENEFLLRVSADRTRVEALHPVRSDLLAKELEDPAFARAEEVALQGLPYVPEVDLEIFLLYFLSRMPGSWEPLREALASLRIETATGAAGVGRALLWWGIRSYLSANRSTLDEAMRVGGDAWAMLVLPDVTGAMESDIAENIIQHIEGSNPVGAESIRRIRRQLTPRAQLFEALSDWLTKLGTLEKPLNLDDWEGVAELTFWSSRLGVPAPVVWNPGDLPGASLSIETLSQLCLALAEAEPEKRAALMRLHGDQMVARFREETDTLILREDDQSVTVEFIVPLEAPSNAPREAADSTQNPRQAPTAGKEMATQNLGSRLNDEAVRRVKLLRGFFPGKDRYCTQGRGHQLSFKGITFPYDSTVKAMPPTAVPISWLVRVNSTLHSLEIYGHRPATWKHFAERLLDVRETVASTLLQLQRALIAYFEGGKPRSLFGGTLSAEKWDQAKTTVEAKVYLPISAVDEWGLSSETQSSGSKDEGFSANIASGFSMRRHQRFSNALRDYLFAVSNFFNQALLICGSHGFIGRNPVTRDRILEVAKGLGYDDNKTRLSVSNLFDAMAGLKAMQTEYGKRIGSLVEMRRLEQVTRREGNLFPELWALWYQFCHHPEKRMHAAGIQSFSAMESELAPLRSAIRGALASDTWKTAVISEAFEWLNHPALVLRLDLSHAGAFEVARAGVVARLIEILKSAVPGSLQWYALEYRWRHILIIPALNGFALGAAAWIIPCSLLSGKDDQETPNSFSLRLLQPLPVERVQQLGLGVSSISAAKPFKELFEELDGIQYYFTHFALFAEQIQALDEIGLRVLERYLKKTAAQLSARFDGLLELMVDVVQRVRRAAMFPPEALDILLEPIDRLIQEIESSRGQTLTVGLKECRAKAEQFQKVQQAVGLFQFSMFPGVLDVGASEPTEAEPSEDSVA
jgi:hypothetical protein